MAGPDFAAHNEEVRQVWEAFHAGRPTRVPCAYAFNTRYLLLTPELNPEGYTFQQYFEDPDLQWRLQLHRQHWIRHNVVQDAEMGLPERWDGLAPDLQNIYEAAWLGCRRKCRTCCASSTRWASGAAACMRLRRSCLPGVARASA